MKIPTEGERACRAVMVRDAVQRLAAHGAATPPGSGQVVAAYLTAHVEDWADAAEVRSWLKNLDGAIRTLRAELYALEA